jgi:hypothetical protein
VAALDELAVTDAIPVRKELDRLLTSHTFAKSPRLSSLLEFIVKHSLDGRPDELTEQQIGIQVFGRAPGYNSSDDTIVRGTARSLRQRLEIYYSAEGSHDPVRIEIPRGAYVAVFHEVVWQAPAPASAAMPLQPIAPPDTIRHTGRNRTVFWLVLGLVMLTFALVGVSVAYFEQSRVARSPAELAGPQSLWHALFTPGRKTLIVPGDASLDAFIAWEQQPVSLEDYARQGYQQNPTVSRPPSHTDVPLGVRSVTPMADLILVSALVRAPEHMGQPGLENSVEVRYARDIAIADTHDNNLILIGSETFNPWVMLYQPEMDFVAHWDFSKDVYRVENKTARAGERLVYEYRRGSGQEQKAITHIALLNNSQGFGRVLVVEGTSMGTTYGAVNFLTHDALWGPAIKAATDGSGRLHDFEVLLSGDFIHGGIGNTKVMVEHVH